MQRPKSERTTLPRPWLSGPAMRTLPGFRSRCTVRAEQSRELRAEGGRRGLRGRALRN